MFTVNFLFCPSKANAGRFKNISCNRNEPKPHKHMTLCRLTAESKIWYSTVWLKLFFICCFRRKSIFNPSARTNKRERRVACQLLSTHFTPSMILLMWLVQIIIPRCYWLTQKQSPMMWLLHHLMLHSRFQTAHGINTAASSPSRPREGDLLAITWLATMVEPPIVLLSEGPWV